MAKVRKPTIDELNSWGIDSHDQYLKLKAWAEEKGIPKKERDLRKASLFEYIKDTREYYEADAPIDKHEQAAILAAALQEELEVIEASLDETDARRNELIKQMRSLEKELERAEARTVPFQARINTLSPQWRKQWVRFYDKFREDDLKTKSEAAALAWAQIKRHCVKEGKTWSCPPWDTAFPHLSKRVKKARKAYAELEAKEKPQERMKGAPVVRKPQAKKKAAKKKPKLSRPRPKRKKKT